MPIAIVLRNSKTECFYRDAIIDSINSGAGNNALLCSGFFKKITTPKEGQLIKPHRNRDLLKP